jgi:hypothetical protein
MNVTPAQIEKINAVKKYYASLSTEHIVGFTPVESKRASAPAPKMARPPEKIPRHWTIVNNSVRKYKWKTYMDDV